MAVFNISLTKNDVSAATNYIKRQSRKAIDVGFSVGGVSRIGISDNTVLDLTQCYLDIPSAPQGDLFIKHEGAYRSLNNPSVREVFMEKSKYVVVSEGEPLPVKSSELKDSQRLFLDKLHDIYQERGVNFGKSVRVSTDSYLTACDTILNSFFYINKNIDSINSTSDAAFDCCLGRSGRGHKQEYWIDQLKSQGGCVSELADIKARVAKVIEKNPLIHSDDIAIINTDFISREQAVRLAGLVEASLLDSSMSLRSEFSCGMKPLTLGDEISSRGVIFGVGHLPKMGGSEYELRIKTDDGGLMKLVSASECFGGLVSKPEVILAISEGSVVKVKGNVLSSTPQYKIGSAHVIPACVTVKASSLTIEVECKKVFSLKM